MYLVQDYVGVNHQVVLGICRQLVCIWRTVRVQWCSAVYVISEVVLPDLLSMPSRDLLKSLCCLPLTTVLRHSSAPYERVRPS